MATLNGGNAALVLVLSSVSIAHAAHHTYKFDQWRCLVPRKKEWFRVLLTWMLIMCNVGMFIWGAGWTFVKYKLGWVTLPGYGALPTPPELFPPSYHGYNTPLTIMLNLSYSLQSALNAEEGLYWYHLMRAVRQPKSARSWLSSNFFYAWIGISVVATAGQSSIGWIGHKGDLTAQLGRELTCGGVIELLVLTSASVVLLKFPAFLQDVKASGAGPEVRARLHFYHEANKVRTFFRLIFTGSILTLGIDGLTKSQTVNLTPIASDFVIQMTLGSYFLVLMISMVLYLPRNYSTAQRSAPVMVAAPRTYAPHDAAQLQLASGHALMSLLREGGQWDEDDDLRAGMSRAPERESAPFEREQSWGAAGDSKWEKDGGSVFERRGGSERDDGDEEGGAVPLALEHFTSPIAVQSGDNVIPRDLKIRVQQEVVQTD